MNLATLNDLTERKKVKSDMEQLKEKVSRENAKIIKLKVAQDTVYWELKEKLSSTERQHETLQRNMVQLQMEHESVSAQYQDELRRRPETLNKLESTRAICDVLEENLGRVRASLQRSAADRAALADAYTRAGAAVAAAHADNEKRLLAATNEARHAKDLARLSGEHGAQLMECVSRERSRADQAAADAERLREQRDNINEHLARRDTLLQEREKIIQELHNELRRATAEFNERYERSKRTIEELEREAGAASALRAALSQAETRGAAATRDLSRLSTELAAMQAAKDEATQRVATLSLQIQETQSHDEKMKEAMQFLIKNGEDLAKQLEDKNEKIRSLEKVADDSKQETHMLAERAAISAEERDRERHDYEKREAEREHELRDCKKIIATAQQELMERTNAIENLMHDIKVLKEASVRAEATISEQATELERERSDNEKRTTATESKLTEYTETIDRLERDIQVEREQRTKTDAALAKLTAEQKREHSEYEEHKTSADHKLAKLNATITRLTEDLAAETEARERANNTLDELNTQHNREREGFEKHAANAELEITKRDNFIAHCKSKLLFVTEERTRVDAVLKSTREELKTARQDAETNLDDVRHLKVDLRRKDEEASKQLQTIFSITAEKEKMQNKIREMEETIKNIQKITQITPPAAPELRREPPEQDDNAMTSPAQSRALDQPASGPQRPRGPTLLDLLDKPSQKTKHEGIYNSFSETSDSMDAGHVLKRNMADRRFEALSRDVPFSPVPLSSLKRSRDTAARKRTPPVVAPPAGPVVSQPPAPATAQAADVPRKFFKTRRAERIERQRK